MELVAVNYSGLVKAKTSIGLPGIPTRNSGNSPHHDYHEKIPSSRTHLNFIIMTTTIIIIIIRQLKITLVSNLLRAQCQFLNPIANILSHHRTVLYL